MAKGFRDRQSISAVAGFNMSAFFLLPVLMLPTGLPVAAAPVQAGEGNLEEIDFLGDIPVVSFATRLNQKIIDAPAATTLITREDIEASGAIEVAQLFKLVPGFLSYHVLGNQFGVTNRGYTLEFPGDLEVMVDGRSVYQPAFSAVEWSSLGITVDDIDHIEVVRGSNTPAYGSNAYLGAINIVTHSPLQTSGTRVGATFGESHTRNGWLRNSGEIGSVHYQLGFSYRHNEGFDALDNADNEPWRRIIDGNDARHLNLRAVYAPSINHSLEINLGVGESDIRIPDDDQVAADQAGFNERQFDNDFQLLRWTSSLGDGDQLRLQFYHNRLQTNERRELGLLSEILTRALDSPVPPAAIPVLFAGHEDEFIVIDFDDALSERYDLELEHRLRLTADQRLVWGLGARHDRIQSFFLLRRDDAVAETSYRAFANWEYSPGTRIKVNLGFMAEENPIVGFHVSPRAAVNYYLQRQQVIRLGVTRGNRSPSVLEANQYQTVTFANGDIIDADVVASESFEPSRVTEFELGYFAELMNGLSLDMRLFRLEAEDVIGEEKHPFPDLEGRISVISNSVNWVTKGFDAQIRLRLNDRSLVSLQYAYTDFDGTRVREGAPIPNILAIDHHLPRHVLSMLASQKLGHGFEASLAWYHQSSVRWRQGDFVDTHDRLDLRLARKFQIAGYDGNVELIAHNVLDDFIEFEKVNTFKTRVLLKFSLAVR